MIQDLYPVSEVNPSWSQLFSRVDNSSSLSLSLQVMCSGSWPDWWPSAEFAPVCQYLPSTGEVNTQQSPPDGISPELDHFPNQVIPVAAGILQCLIFNVLNTMRFPLSQLPSLSRAAAMPSSISTGSSICTLPPIYSATILQVWWKRNDGGLYPSLATCTALPLFTAPVPSPRRAVMVVSHNLFLRNAFWLFQVALLILFRNSFCKYLVHNLPQERGKNKQPTVFWIFFLTLLEEECGICLFTVVMNFPPSPLIFWREEKWLQFAGLILTWTDHGTEGQKCIIIPWPMKDPYPRTGLCAGSAASTSPVLLQQMPMHSASGTGELPHSTTSPARPTRKKHEMMINIQFSLNSWLKKHAKAFFSGFKYNTGNQGLQNIHCSIKKQIIYTTRKYKGSWE